MEDQDKSKVSVSRTILASHLPATSPKWELQEFFSSIGPLKKCFMVRSKDSGDFTGVAYVTYSDAADATTAVQELNHKSLNNNKINVKFSKQKDQDDKPKEDIIEPVKLENNSTIKECFQPRKHFKKEDRKELKEKAKEKKGRLIIRNLSFKATKKTLKQHFSPYGPVSEVVILQKNGKMVGCGFIQFDTVKSALNAIQACNMKPYLGRPISVDFAIPKDCYKSKVSQVNIKEETEDGKVNEEESPIKKEIKLEVSSSDSEDDDDDDDSSEESEEENEEESSSSPPAKSTYVPRLTASKDVAEGRTLFLSNLSFDSTENDVRELLEKYGKLKYVLLCMDPLTEHPKGTGFAQFIEREDADKCLSSWESDPNEFIVGRRPMRISRAMSREQIVTKKEEDKTHEKNKDNRNLYLAREGLIREGTLAAKDMSKSDQEQRNGLERNKRNLLKNLNVFVSNVRLCIHNIPEEVNDKQFRQIFIKNSTDGAKISEARIMRDLRNLDDKGIGKSKGFGFITFEQHEHALSALRTINNNPSVFTKNKRPMVEFSLENRTVLKARKMRDRKSKENNPMINNKKKMTSTGQSNLDEPKSSFMGSVSTKGQKSLPRHVGPKVRHKNRDTGGKKKISRNHIRRDAAKTFSKKRGNSGNPKSAKKQKINS